VQRIHRQLFVLDSDLRLQGRIKDAARVGFSVEIAANWEGLLYALRRASLTAVAVVDPYSGAPSGANDLAPELRRLLREFPSMSVLAAVRPRPGRYDDLRTLGELGVAQMIVVQEADVAAIRQLLEYARGRPLQNLLDRTLPKLSGSARSILINAADIAAAGGQAEDIARAMFAAPRTLNRMCERAGLPPPRRTLGYMRLLLAAELLDEDKRTIEEIAYACGYASDSGLRRAFVEFLGSNPKSLRKSGAFRAAARAFRAEVTLPRVRRNGKEITASLVG
jgi:AraC-like DNA-binding protein